MTAATNGGLLRHGNRESANVTRDERLAAVNSLIVVIASCGRRFWRNRETGAVARMEIDDRGKIWWINEWFYVPKHERLCMSVGRYNLLHRGWPHGGTLRDLAIAFRDFVRTGEPINPGWFGPWPSWVCGDGDRWGYGLDNMATIREASIRLGVAKEREAVKAEG